MGNNEGLSRRGFLGALSGVLMGTYVAGKSLVTGQTLDSTKYKSALDFMTKTWNTHVKGTGTKYLPKEIILGSDLFEAFETELTANQRYIYYTSNEDCSGLPKTETICLMFKASRAFKANGPGWWMMMDGKTYYPWT